MAYTLYLLARSGEPVAQRVILQLIEAAMRLDSAISSAPSGDGVGWAAHEVSTSQDLGEQSDDPLLDLFVPRTGGGPILLQVNTRPGAVRQEVDGALRNGAPGPVAGSDTLIELTLSGHTTDWLIADVISSVAMRLWDAVMYDEELGFDISFDEHA
ncbi:hypothetical protein [Actinoplanes solisilvae]|uniref:hypothetical protein n=1 Tax=Actinoplanes solisilvae TaxID=2486853 RepID=UPI000FD7661A|nr:hypothetical protein [Actinoplanes solisilvae]